MNSRSGNRRSPLVWVSVVAVLAVLAVGSYIVAPRVTTDSFTAEFPSATGLYAGDEVKVMGVAVGRIDAIEPAGDKVRVRFHVDKDRPVPAGAKAVVMSPNLVSSRFVQLTPVYTGGPKLADGATIPLGRTAVPVEWDQIKTQLQRLATALGPTDTDPRGPLGQIVDTAAADLRGAGPSLHETLTTLSAAMKTLSEGRGDLVSIVANLQTFVTALSQSGQQIVAIDNRLATVSTLLADNRGDMGDALAGLDGALGEVTRFVADNRARLGGSVDGLSAVAGTLAQQRDGLAQVLHVAPNALANLENIYQPAHNAVVSALALSNFANPVNFVCSAIAAAERSDAQQGARSCVRYLGPLLELLRTDYPPLAVNPSRGVGALPGQLAYSTPDLVPPEPPRPPSLPPPLAQLPPPLAQLLIPGGTR
ncbi:phospholipid/cholesterol/gamma-HCH transport system substrate-binding protein [Nocardia transvalensis]|uniref:Phospholipid/cholesterol/gamma-HCH transport system substrate-binding protein n=1 Tax=Nocardia transvalensis TaxID=37333 RepID=A0A7W9PKR2_9NOCA|nr:MCE family protein [Nocardia transvalensis]MBB5917817.1 phospholipid/cholesterol/gamma-HCH transport system substrate-binding protein [Nocardia transvalensis]